MRPSQWTKVWCRCYLNAWTPCLSQLFPRDPSAAMEEVWCCMPSHGQLYGFDPPLNLCLTLSASGNYLEKLGHPAFFQLHHRPLQLLPLLQTFQDSVSAWFKMWERLLSRDVCLGERVLFTEKTSNFETKEFAKATDRASGFLKSELRWMQPQ